MSCCAHQNETFVKTVKRDAPTFRHDVVSGFSREAAAEYIPRRKPWVSSENARKSRRDGRDPPLLFVPLRKHRSLRYRVTLGARGAKRTDTRTSSTRFPFPER